MCIRQHLMFIFVIPRPRITSPPESKIDWRSITLKTFLRQLTKKRHGVGCSLRYSHARKSRLVNRSVLQRVPSQTKVFAQEHGNTTQLPCLTRFLHTQKSWEMHTPVLHRTQVQTQANYHRTVLLLQITTLWTFLKSCSALAVHMMATSSQPCTILASSTPPISYIVLWSYRQLTNDHNSSQHRCWRPPPHLQLTMTWYGPIATILTLNTLSAQYGQ